MDNANGANIDGSEASRDPRICQPNLQVFTEQDYEGLNVVSAYFSSNSILHLTPQNQLSTRNSHNQK